MTALWDIRGKTILVGDRNPYVRRLLQRELINAGYQVLLAENGRQLLLLAERNPHLDLIVVDPDLPDKDVISLFDQLGRHGVPVLVHCHPGEELEKAAGCGYWIVEKGGHSIEVVLSMIVRVISCAS